MGRRDRMVPYPGQDRPAFLRNEPGITAACAAERPSSAPTSGCCGMPSVAASTRMIRHQIVSTPPYIVSTPHPRPPTVNITPWFWTTL